MSGSDVDGTGGIGETSQGPGRPRRTAIERKKPIGIAYVLPGLGYGGTEKHVRDLSARLDRARFSPILICTGGNDLLPRELDGWDIPVYPLHYRGASVHPGKALPLARDAVSFFRSFRRILAKHRTGIVHAYLPAANILGMIASSFAGIRVRIVSKRALCRYKDGHSVYSFFENLANLAADVILVNSDAVRRDIERTEGNWEGKFRKIYNGVAPIDRWTDDERQAFRDREGIPVGARVVLSVSNFYPYKGHLDLVEAAGYVASREPETVFWLVGRDAGTLELCRTRVRENGLGSRVLFLGSRTDIPDLLRACDLFVHPSHEEGFSNAILEAMAGGRPVVACDVGGNPEAIRDGENGLLVPPNDPRALAAAILSLLRDPARGIMLGEAGRTLVGQRFSLKRMVEEVEKTYMELLEGPPLSCGV